MSRDGQKETRPKGGQRAAETKSQADTQTRHRRAGGGDGGAEQPRAPPAAAASGRRHQPGELRDSLGPLPCHAPIYLHGPEIQEFLRAASGAASGQQTAASGPGPPDAIRAGPSSRFRPPGCWASPACDPLRSHGPDQSGLSAMPEAGDGAQGGGPGRRRRSQHCAWPSIYVQCCRQSLFPAALHPSPPQICPFPWSLLPGTPLFLLANSYSSLKTQLAVPSSEKAFLGARGCLSGPPRALSVERLTLHGVHGREGREREGETKPSGSHGLRPHPHHKTPQPRPLSRPPV